MEVIITYIIQGSLLFIFYTWCPLCSATEGLPHFSGCFFWDSFASSNSYDLWMLWGTPQYPHKFRWIKKSMPPHPSFLPTHISRNVFTQYSLNSTPSQIQPSLASQFPHSEAQSALPLRGSSACHVSRGWLSWWQALWWALSRGPQPLTSHGLCPS